jgi:hypothetical protein
VHGGERRDRLQLLEESSSSQIAHVQDQRRALEETEAPGRQAACAARQVRVSDERDQRNSGRKAPFRYTSSPSA